MKNNNASKGSSPPFASRPRGDVNRSIPSFARKNEERKERWKKRRLTVLISIARSV
jgi:hypothetical protein